MLLNILIGLLLIGLTVIIQGFGTIIWLNYVRKHYLYIPSKEFIKKRFQILVFSALFLLMLHFFEASLWALVYYVNPNITAFETFEKALYFSLVTFTTLGYGDITISTGSRILAGFEAANGVLMLGWSTALMFTTVNYIFKISEEK